MATLTLCAGIIALPIISVGLIKTLRVLVPQFAPVTCVSANLCLDDTSRTQEATHLVREAVEFVERNVGAIKNPSRVIFCATQECSDYFGLDGVAGYNVGTYGIVIKPNGWLDYIVRHELIHHLQNERVGTWRNLMSTPKWLYQGMAYSLSDDPRRPLDNTHGIEDMRARFEIWYKDIDPADIWAEMKNQ